MHNVQTRCLPPRSLLARQFKLVPSAGLRTLTALFSSACRMNVYDEHPSRISLCAQCPRGRNADLAARLDVRGVGSCRWDLATARRGYSRHRLEGRRPFDSLHCRARRSSRARGAEVRPYRRRRLRERASGNHDRGDPDEQEAIPAALAWGARDLLFVSRCTDRSGNSSSSQTTRGALVRPPCRGAVLSGREPPGARIARRSASGQGFGDLRRSAGFVRKSGDFDCGSG